MQSNEDAGETSLLERIIKVDIGLSTLIFQLPLPLPLEFLLSLPGNLIGPPLIQVVGPLWMMVLMDNGFNVEGEIMTWSVLCVLAVGATIGLLLVPWIMFLQGQSWVLSRYFFSHLSFALCPLVGIALSNAYTGMAWPDSNKWYVTAACNHFLMLYNASCIVVLWLKQWTKRTRPCCTFSHSPKNFTIIPRLLCQLGPDTSFPSGDVMAATCLALPLWSGKNELQFVYLPVLLVTLTALGRMYFLAHHLCDTLAGMAIPCCLHLLSGSFLLPRFGTAQWFHPLGAFLALVVAARFRKSNKK